MKQFVLFFISLFLLGVGARSQEMYQKKVFISSRGDSLNYRLLRPEVERRDCNILWYSFCTVPVSGGVITRSS